MSGGKKSHSYVPCKNPNCEGAKSKKAYAITDGTYLKDKCAWCSTPFKFSKEDRKRVEDNRKAYLASGKVLPSPKQETRAMRKGRVASLSPTRSSRLPPATRNSGGEQIDPSLAQCIELMCNMMAASSQIPKEMKDIAGVISNKISSDGQNSNNGKKSSQLSSPLKEAEKIYTQRRNAYKVTQKHIEDKKLKLLRLQQGLSEALQEAADLESTRMLQLAEMTQAEIQLTELISAAETSSVRAPNADTSQGGQSGIGAQKAQAKAGVTNANDTNSADDIDGIYLSRCWHLLGNKSEAAGSSSASASAPVSTTMPGGVQVPVPDAPWTAADDEAAQIAAENPGDVDEAGMPDVVPVNQRTRTLGEDDDENGEDNEAPTTKRTCKAAQSSDGVEVGSGVSSGTVHGDADAKSQAPMPQRYACAKALAMPPSAKALAQMPLLRASAKAKAAPLGDFAKIGAELQKAMAYGGAPVGPSLVAGSSAAPSSSVSEAGQDEQSS